MKKILFILFLILSIVQNGTSQGVGTWKTYLAYYNTTAVAESNNYVFGIANGSLYRYDKDDKSIKTYSKQTGLSDSDINLIGYNSNTNTLLIIYSNGNIDLLNENGNIYNIPYLMNNINILDKTINSIYFHNESAYLSSAFGILIVDMKKQEITDTYRLGVAINSVCIDNKTIYAATSGKLLYIPSMDEVNPLDKNNWSEHPYITETNISKIYVFQNVPCYLINGKGAYYLQNNAINRLIEDTLLKDMVLVNGKLIPYTSSKAYIYSSLTNVETVNMGIVNGISSLKNENTYYIAAGNESIKGIRKKTNSNEYEWILSGISINSPKRNLAAFMTCNNQKLLVTGGGRWTNRNNIVGTLMVYENNEWYNFNEDKIRNQANIKFEDVTSVAVDPRDENHYFVSTWGEGVFEFKNNEFEKLYNHTNSTLNTIYNNNDARNYVRVDGLCYDKNNNLWMTNTVSVNSIASGNGGINVLKVDGTWSKLSYQTLNSQELIDKILITSNGDKWVNIQRPDTKKGIFVFNDKGTIDDVNDDETNFITTFYQTSGGIRESITVNNYYCTAEDKEGQIWMGTNIGPIVCTNPTRALSNPDNLLARRITQTGEDGQLGYFLNGESVRAIAVDGGNRKWIGTETSGIFLVNEDGSETIHNFTTKNSPLLSDNIQSIAINEVTGEVFIGTSNGIVSYMGGATQGSKDYSDIYAYPNPVRPEHNDQVTIVGLMDDSNVKITDLNGNLIYQSKSLGGQLTWNCRNHKGQRVATGIYLVLAATPDANESVVTKIMVIK